MKTLSAQKILIVLLAFLALGAIGGGMALIISPSGELLGGLPVSILEHSPFTDFLVPGIILFLILGIAPTFLIYALLKKPANKFAEYFNVFNDMYWAWSFSIYIAFALIIWIQVGTIIIKNISWLQTFYMLYAIPVIIVALLPQVRNNYKKGNIGKCLQNGFSILGLVLLTLLIGEITNGSGTFGVKECCHNFRMGSTINSPN